MTIRLAGEIFQGYNKPKRDKQGGKKFAVAAKEGDQVRLVRFGTQIWKLNVMTPSEGVIFVRVITVMSPRAN